MGVTIELYRCCIGVFNTYFLKTKSKPSKQVSTGKECPMSRTIIILLATTIFLNISLALSIYTSASVSYSRLQVDYPVNLFQRSDQPPPWPTSAAPPWSGSSTSPRSRCSLPPWSSSKGLSYASTFIISGVYIPHLPSRALAWVTPSQQWKSSRRTSIFPPEILNRSPSSPLHCRINSLFYMVTNFQSRYKIGNKKNKGIKISHWNKGGSFLINKMAEIKNVIANISPKSLDLVKPICWMSMTPA